MTATLPYRPRHLDRVLTAARPERVGAVDSVVGLGIRVTGIPAAIGDLLIIGDGDRATSDRRSGTRAEVVAVARDAVTAMPLDPLKSVTAGTEVRTTGQSMSVPVGLGLLGRVIDAVGDPLDGKGPLKGITRVQLDHEAPSSMLRARIDQPLSVGVRALDTLTTIGRGQRMGLFAGSGVGKSSLLSMIARGTAAEVSVIALIGERGREVREFLEDDLGPEGLARSVVVVSTADQPALMRVRAAFTATRIADSFRESEAHVMLMMDSVTRVAHAQREVGLSIGEPPATRGYPPSVFGLLARLLERAGTGPVGSVTGLYTVLVDGDDHNEPIADAVRSILDGHVVLDRKLAVSGHFPAIDALASVSRVSSRVTTPEQRDCALTLRRVMAARAAAQDLLDVGAYQRGANPLVDAAVDHQARIAEFLTQSMDERSAAETSWTALASLVQKLGVV